jgi:rod shape-determining protein MreC
MAMREKRWRGLDRLEPVDRSSRSTLVALVLACATLITLDHVGGALDPARQAVGELVGPAEDAADGVVAPFEAIPRWFHTRSSLEDRVAELEAKNAQLRQQVSTTALDRNRLAEYDGLAATAGTVQHTLVPAHVIGHGPAQSFSQTVTIDAGTSSGVHADQTVLNNDGLVGRVIAATRTTATVLLLLDRDSVVGGRLGGSMVVGFLQGRGRLSGDATLDLKLLDGAFVANEGDTAVTFGSEDGAPYIAGVPIGTVTAVYSSPRETSRRVEIKPFVDFTALDLVGVAVPSGTRSDRALVRPGKAVAPPSTAATQEEGR